MCFGQAVRSTWEALLTLCSGLSHYFPDAFSNIVAATIRLLLRSSIALRSRRHHHHRWTARRAARLRRHSRASSSSFISSAQQLCWSFKPKPSFHREKKYNQAEASAGPPATSCQLEQPCSKELEFSSLLQWIWSLTNKCQRKYFDINLAENERGFLSFCQGFFHPSAFTFLLDLFYSPLHERKQCAHIFGLEHACSHIACAEA